MTAISSKMSNTTQRRKILLIITAIAVSCMFALLLAEGMARLVYNNKEALFDTHALASWFNNQLSFDPYEIPSEKYGLHWRLKPGYTSDIAAVRDSKISDGKFLNTLSTPPGGVAFRINSDGFRGPDLNPPGECCRILMLGDSVTFGLIDASYPRFVEKELRDRGISTEVINGGVEGYAIRNLKLELPRYIELSPDVVTIMIGWNDLFATNPVNQLTVYHPRLLWLIDSALSSLSRMTSSDVEFARQEFLKLKEPNERDPLLKTLEFYKPRAQGQIAKLIDQFRQHGANVFLMTLPGLFHSGTPLDPTAIQMSHLPTFTNNPLVLMRLTEIYNRELRELSEMHEVKLIDLEKWSEAELKPRSDYYIDSVHLTAEGLRKMAHYIAERLDESNVAKMLQ